MDINEKVRLAQKGNDEAFYELIEPCKEQLYKMAYSYFFNEDHALEAVQETTCRAFTKIKKLKQPEFFKTWLVRILIRVCLDELNKKKRNRELQLRLSANQSAVHEPKDTIDQRLSLQAVLGQMDPKFQMVIQLKYFHDFTIPDIAKAMKKPEGTIKTWLNKALKHLRENYAKGDELHV